MPAIFFHSKNRRNNSKSLETTKNCFQNWWTFDDENENNNTESKTVHLHWRPLIILNARAVIKQKKITEKRRSGGAWKRRTEQKRLQSNQRYCDDINTNVMDWRLRMWLSECVRIAATRYVNLHGVAVMCACDCRKYLLQQKFLNTRTHTHALRDTYTDASEIAIFSLLYTVCRWRQRVGKILNLLRTFVCIPMNYDINDCFAFTCLFLFRSLFKIFLAMFWKKKKNIWIEQQLTIEWRHSFEMLEQLGYHRADKIVQHTHVYTVEIRQNCRMEWNWLFSKQCLLTLHDIFHDWFEYQIIAST